VDVVTMPWRSTRLPWQPRAWLARAAPTRRSLAVGLGMLAFALGAYLVARETSLFAINRIEVHGGSRPLAGQVRRALASFAGRPLVGLDGSAVLQKVDALPTVVSATYDRAFPHTLRITVVPERPAAVLRRGSESWLVSARGRVMGGLAPSSLPRLPRIWISTGTAVRTGAEVPGAGAATAARSLGQAGAFAPRIASASYGTGELVFHLRSGLQLLLGDGSEVKLKLAVAEHVVAVMPSTSTFVDVSIPGRPVSGTGGPDTRTSKTSSSG
jgi:cell division protein FtsQ